MILEDKLINEIIGLEQEAFLITQNRDVTKMQLEGYLKALEKRRYNILNRIKIYNKGEKNTSANIRTINDEYKATINNDILKIYIPEIMPAYKNLDTFVYKNILLNVEDKVNKYKDMFKQEVFIYIKVFDNKTNWDIDNKYVKVIPDALTLSGVIKDDNINNLFYCVKGEVSNIPHTEAFIMESSKIKNLLEKIIAENVDF